MKNLSDLIWTITQFQELLRYQVMVLNFLNDAMNMIESGDLRAAEFAVAQLESACLGLAVKREYVWGRDCGRHNNSQRTS